jgi:hypothetical protein
MAATSTRLRSRVNCLFTIRLDACARCGYDSALPGHVNEIKTSRSAGVSMDRVQSQCAERAPLRPTCRVLTIRMLTRALFAAALGLAAAGCTTDGQPDGIGPGAALAPNARTTVAFESVDGPPPGVFQKFVDKLNDQAQRRNVAVVTRDGAAQYRVRGYFAAHVIKGQTTIAWVWDVYDAAQQRTLRLSGEESGGRAGRDAWASADDAMLQKIAANGMDGLVAFLASPPAPAAPNSAPSQPSSPPPASQAIAMAEPHA